MSEDNYWYDRYLLVCDNNNYLTEQLAEANKHKQDWHNMYQETYDQLVAVNRELECYKIQFEKDYSEFDIEMIMRLSCQLAERDKLIENQQAEIERLREKVLWPPNPSTWTVIRITELNKLEAENSDLRAEVAALKQVSAELCPDCGWAMKFPDEPCCKCEVERLSSAIGLREYTKHIRKQTAREILIWLTDQRPMAFSERPTFDNMVRRFKAKFGLEG